MRRHSHDTFKEDHHMHLIRSILPLAAAALSTAAVRPAAAQQTAAFEHVRPAVARAVATPDTVQLRTLAVYRFGASQIAGMPSQVTLADSAGELVATFRRPGAPSSAPMVVDVLGTDITLHGATPSGVLTLVLYGQNDPDASGALTGHWTLGTRQGELRGRAER
jgi:hypothetical protein